MASRNQAGWLFGPIPDLLLGAGLLYLLVVSGLLAWGASARDVIPAVWAAPVVLLAPDLLGRPDFDFGLAVCVAAAVNIHHLVLEGAIWKLRNPRLAAILLGSQSDASGETSRTTTLV